MTTVVLEHLQHANSAGPDLTIDANGFIGVGTASPARPLSVVATGNTTSVFERTDGTYVLEMKGSGTTSPAAFGMSGNDLVALVNNSEKLRVDSNGALLLGTTTRNVYYNSSTQYAATAVIKTNISNDVADLVITNGTNNFGSTIDFARTNAAGNDVRYALMGGIATSNTTGSETGYLTFRTKDSTDNNIVERMRIDNAGRVTTPYQPAFDAYYTSNGTWSISANNTLVFNATTFNQGGHYNTSNGRFTAPVSGVYHFTYYSIYVGNYGNADLNLYVNGGRGNGVDRHFTSNEGNNWNTIGGANTRYLNAGDYVSVFSRSGADFHGGYWSNFSGHLVG